MTKARDNFAWLTSQLPHRGNLLRTWPTFAKHPSLTILRAVAFTYEIVLIKDLIQHASIRYHGRHFSQVSLQYASDEILHPSCHCTGRHLQVRHIRRLSQDGTARPPSG